MTNPRSRSEILAAEVLGDVGILIERAESLRNELGGTLEKLQARHEAFQRAESDGVKQVSSSLSQSVESLAKTLKDSEGRFIQSLERRANHFARRMIILGSFAGALFGSSVGFAIARYL